MYFWKWFIHSAHTKNAVFLAQYAMFECYAISLSFCCSCNSDIVYFNANIQWKNMAHILHITFSHNHADLYSH